MADAPRITAEELHQKLDQGEQIMLVDVRRGAWDRAQEKIKGATRIDPNSYETELDALPPGASVATYCT